MKVVIVAMNASTRFGGEAILPWHYFRLLRKRGVQAWLVAHERTRRELTALLPDEIGWMRFVPDRAVQRWLHKMSGPLPKGVAEITLGWSIGLYTSWMQRKIVRDLVSQHGVDIVHEPVPVSPRQPSLMCGVGAPVVIGPMNGGMTYPPAFVKSQGLLERWLVWTGRFASNALNAALPGKRRAAVLLVANRRTRRALPRGIAGEVIEMTENGVDLNLFRSAESPSVSIRIITTQVRFRRASHRVEGRRPAFGSDGQSASPLRSGTAYHWRWCRSGLGSNRSPQRKYLSDRVIFHGFLPQKQCAELLAGFDVLVLPSLHECGGAVVLEAMAMGLPVIATKWGGPADYLDKNSGILIEPAGRERFIEDTAEAMVKLARSPELRRKLGNAGRARVVKEFDWEKENRPYPGDLCSRK